MKTCATCNLQKELSCFYKHPKSNDGYFHQCKDCKKSYERNNKHYKIYEKTEKGVIRIIYKTQKRNSVLRGHNAPKYSKDEFREWLYDNGFESLFNAWSSSGYEKALKPSVDRLNDYKGYSFDNIRLVTWKENKDKQVDDILLGRSTSGERCKPVIQLDMKGQFVNEFVSISEAMRSTSVHNIDMVCKGSRKSAGGFKWIYK